MRRWPVAGPRRDRQPVHVLHTRQHDRLAVARNGQQRRLLRLIAQTYEKWSRDETQIELLQSRFSEREQLSAQAVVPVPGDLEYHSKALQRG